LTSPLPIFYYEVTILQGFAVSIGFAHDEYNCLYQPGWERCSVGFHCDDGGIFIQNANQASNVFEQCGTGDTVGMGIYMRTGEVFVTKNGRMLGIVCCIQTRNRIVPTVGMFNTAQVVVNFGNIEPFKYKIEQLPIAMFGKLTSSFAPKLILKHKRMRKSFLDEIMSTGASDDDNDDTHDKDYKHFEDANGDNDSSDEDYNDDFNADTSRHVQHGNGKGKQRHNQQQQQQQQKMKGVAVASTSTAAAPALSSPSASSSAPSSSSSTTINKKRKRKTKNLTLPTHIVDENDTSDGEYVPKKQRTR